MRKQRTRVDILNQIKDLEKDVGVCKFEIKEKQKSLSKKMSVIDKLKNELNGLKIVDVSDHAIVRYMERSISVDVDEIKDSIIGDEFVSMVGKYCGKGKFPLKNGMTAVVENYVIVTIY